MQVRSLLEELKRFSQSALLKCLDAQKIRIRTRTEASGGSQEDEAESDQTQHQIELSWAQAAHKQASPPSPLACFEMP
jgi:hypothetical protein